MPTKRKISDKKRDRKGNVEISEALNSLNVHMTAVRMHLDTYRRAGATKNSGFYLERAERHIRYAYLNCVNLPEDLKRRYGSEISVLEKEYNEILAQHNFADSLRHG